jgi:hypothetical protein
MLRIIGVLAEFRNGDLSKKGRKRHLSLELGESNMEEGDRGLF